jgi:hypothetical protein
MLQDQDHEITLIFFSISVFSQSFCGSSSWSSTQRRFLSCNLSSFFFEVLFAQLEINRVEFIFFCFHTRELQSMVFDDRLPGHMQLVV